MNGDFEKKLSLYERIVKIFSFIKYPFFRNFEKKIKDEIEFTGLKVSPKEAISASINLPLIIFLFSFALFFFKLIDFSLFAVLILFSAVVFYFLFNYTKYYSYYYRTKASSEMVLSILYMSIALKVRPNLENAIYYAATNLTGPLGDDLKKGLHDLYTRKKLNAAEVFDEIAKKWRIESEEFVHALELLKASSARLEEMDKNLRNALDLIIRGTTARMESYAYKMKTPLTIITMFGITLPLMALVLFPVFFLFAPELASPSAIALTYDVLLGFIVYILLFQNLFRRPFSFHQPIIAEIKGLKKIRRNALFFSLSLGLILSILCLIFIVKDGIKLFEESKFFLSLALVFFIPLSFILYNFIMSKTSFPLSISISEVEKELPNALLILSSELKLNKPVEKAFEDSLKKFENVETRKFFESIVKGMRIGLTLEDSIFGRHGTILSYPSRIIKMVMRVISDIAKEGSIFLASALDSISSFLKDAEALELKTKEILSEIVHDIRMHCLVVAPLTAGIIVGLTIFVLALFFYFEGSLGRMKDFFEKYGAAGTIFAGGIFGLWQISGLIPAPVFQLIVGIYLVQLTMLLSYFYNEIMYGEDEASRKNNNFKSMLIVILFYLFVVLALYFGIKSFINLEELARLI